jgi:hypothetical protein
VCGAEGGEALEEGEDEVVLAADDQSQEGHFPHEELSGEHLHVLLGVQQLGEVLSHPYLSPELS